MFREYQVLIREIDQLCDQIRHQYGDQISCKKGCSGNCCQRHITIFPLEAVVYARALRRQSSGLSSRIQRKARHTTSFGPCPLLENGACLMYESRAIICRTHGYPILSEYRGHRSIGYCHKNFKDYPPLPGDRMFELAPLNERLNALNLRFLSEYAGCLPRADRLTMGEALLLEIPYF